MAVGLGDARRQRRSGLAFAAVLPALLLACGQTTSTPPIADAGRDGAAPVDAFAPTEPPEVDAGAEDARDAGRDVDNGAPSSVYPALHPAEPEVKSYGGPVLKAPKIVAVTFDGDALRADIETFASSIGASAYWKAIGEEYGVGAATAGTPIHLTETAPAVITSEAIDTWLIGKLDGTHPEWGSGDPSTIYSIYYPAQTLIDLATLGKSCQVFGGYHAEVKLANGTKVPYAIMPRCGGFQGQTALERLTVTSSHEFIEASTDPFPYTRPAYAITDNAHLVWVLAPLPEVADMCTYRGGADFTPSDLPFLVQRSWSNRSAKKGTNPCVPPPVGEPYFNAAPVLNEDVEITFGSITLGTKGVKIPVGQEKTIDVVLFSDASTNGPWTVSAMDAALDRGEEPDLALHLDRGTGVNGEKLHLRIKTLRPGKNGGSEFILYSTHGEQMNTWMGFVAN